MFGIGKREITVFVVAAAIIFIVPFLFSPINTWQAGFWDYFNNTPPIMWLGELSWIIIFATLFTIAITGLERLFFD
jgi:hypothetical protein